MGDVKALLALSLALAATTASAEIKVQVQDGRVWVQAVSAPLADLLDRLAQETGMGVVYEGKPPRIPVTLVLEGLSEAEAVLRTLEGTGLDFALRLDRAATGVEMLILTDPSGTARSASRGPETGSPPAPPGRPAYRPPPAPPSPEQREELEERRTRRRGRRPDYTERPRPDPAMFPGNYSHPR